MDGEAEVVAFKVVIVIGGCVDSDQWLMWLMPLVVVPLL